MSMKEKRSEKKEKVLFNDCLKFLGKTKSLHSRTLQDFLTEENIFKQANAFLINVHVSPGKMKNLVSRLHVL